MLIRHAAITAIICAIAFFSPMDRALASPNWQCTQDLNGDGSIDVANEQASCLTASNGELCPINAVDCVIQSSSATCPAIAPLDPVTGKCEMPPQCATGSYDSTNHYCVASSPPTCSSPTATFYSSTSLCAENPSCPSGATFNSTLQVCVTTASPVCVTGMAFNSNNGRCESAPSCPTGGTYSSSTQMCQVYNIQDPICPANTTFNAVSNMCEAAYSCSQGTFDATSKKCLSTYSASCPAGTTFDGMNGQCESAGTCVSGVYDSVQKTCVTTTFVPPTCPVGSTLNPTTNMCEASAVCPSGATYDSASQTCLAPPVCASGTYDPISKMCIAQSTTAPVCSPGLTYPGAPSSICSGAYTCPANTVDNGAKCVAAPTCLSGTYDPVTDVCDISNTTYSNPSCAAGTSLNVSLNKCIATPTCSSGAYSSSQNQCVITAAGDCGTYAGYPNNGPQWPPWYPNNNYYWSRCWNWWWAYYGYYVSTGYPTCPANTTWNTTDYLCEGSFAATCPSGTSLDGALDLCTETPPCLSGTYDNSLHKCVTVTISTIPPTCPAGTSLNIATNKCEANYVCPAGSSYNLTVTQKCESTPTCSSGIFTPSTGNCILNTSSAPTCLSGGTFNPSLNKCVAALSCPTGLSWDSAKNICDGAAPACVSGTYDSITHMCAKTTVAAPSCTIGTFNSGDGKCELPLACPNGSMYDMILGICALKLSPTCPGGTFFDSTATICDAAPSCPNTYIYNQAQGKCIYTLAYDPTCPNGTAVDVVNNVCYSTPTCGSGLSYDSANFVCTASQAASCSSPSETFDKTTNLCESSPLCSAGTGTYDSTQKLCLARTQATCPNGGYLNTTLKVCQASPGCSSGTFDTNSGMCASTGGATEAATCTPGVLNTSTNSCQTLPTCSAGTYNPVSGLCVTISGSTSPPSCPSGSSLNISSGMCETTPTCQTNYTFDTTQHLCVSFVKSCPLNTASNTYTCMDMGSGSLKCSPNTCFDLNVVSQTTTTTDTTALYNDGTTDSNTGQCSGSIYIFNGRPMTCRPPGLKTTYWDCCNNAAAPSAISPTEEAAILLNPALTIPGSIYALLAGLLNSCTSQEVITDTGIAHRMCHYVGNFCSSHLNTGFSTYCTQTTTTYCCFQSLLGRIIQEQGRPQLKAFQPGGAWGIAQFPNCKGFTPEQFQMLDFSKMDLSEYFSEVAQQMGSQIKTNMVNDVNKFYQNTLH